MSKNHSKSNFTTTTIEIEECLEKIDAIKERTAALIAAACKSREESGNVDNRMASDIDNLIKKFSDSDKVQILEDVIVQLCKSGKSSKRDDYAADYGDIFGSRKRK